MYKIDSTKLKGIFKIPSSKSHLHRLIIVSLLKRDVTTIYRATLCEDTTTTLDICYNIGCIITYHKNKIVIDSSNLSYDKKKLFCNKSASTFRMLTPVLIYLFSEVNLSMDNELLLRPFNGYNELFELNGVSVVKNLDGYTFKGSIKNINISLNDLESSQYASGVMFLLVMLNNSHVYHVSNLGSKGYLDLTVNTLKSFGFNINHYLDHIEFKSSSFKSNDSFNVDSCFSSYAFIKVGNLICQDMEYFNFINEFEQPDQIIDYICDNKITEIDIDESPDLFPILVVYSIYLKEEVSLLNCQRTKIKESNRFLAMTEILDNLKISYTISDENLTICNSISKLDSITIDTKNDHRIALSAFVISLLCDYVIIDNIKCIDKSYPTFINQYLKFGGVINE